jgi:type I restriction enzyme S subunit
MSKNNENKLVPKLRFPEFTNEIWKRKTIDETCEVLNNLRKPLTSNLREKGEYPYYGASGIIDFVKNFIFNERLLLIGEDGAKWGAYEKTAFIADGKYWVNNHAHVLKPTGVVDTLLENYLVKLDLSPFITGAAPPKLTLGKLKSIPVPIPNSRKEQQKIAACLSSLDEVITAESQKLEVLKDHKRGLLQNILPVGKETIPKLRFKEFQNADEWNEDTLANIASFRRGSFPQPYGLPKWYDDENGMPFIQVFDVGEDFRLKPTTKRKISSLAAEQSVFIPIGTLIITIQGSIGRVAITQYDAYIDRTLLLFEEFYQEVDITFFAYTIFLLFEIEKQKAPGGIIKTITKEVLSSFVVKLPSIEEQQKIASSLTSLDELISAQTEKIESLQFHKKGLLQGLFPNVNEVTE